MKTLILVAGLLLLACRVQAQSTSGWVDLEKKDGAGLFGEKCGMCHRTNGMGVGILARRMKPELALLENRTDLQPQFIDTVVRNGLGLMYPISRGEVSDEQLGKISQYLVKPKGGK